MKLLGSLTNRIFYASAALTVLCITAAIYLVNARVTASAEEELRRGLFQTGEVVDQQTATASTLFAVLARQIADAPTLKAAVDTADPPTVEPIAREYGHRIESDLFLVTHRSGRVLFARWPAGGGYVVDPGPAIRDAVEGRENTTFWPHADGVLQIVNVPISAGTPPDIIGTVSVGFMFDRRMAERFKRLTGSEIAFGMGGRVVVSTLPGAGRCVLERKGSADPISRVSVGEDEYLALLRPLAADPTSSFFGAVETSSAAPASPIGMDDGHPVAVILRSRTERLGFLRPVRAALVATGVAVVLLATFVSYGIARTITRPLDAITAAMREMATTGDLTRSIDWRETRWDDEDARLLARTFNTLTDSVTRFQRQAAERERLSALGRLSTVIAHEVRNPLMIIRGSLRLLTRGGASAADIREAAADIDEEVSRLDRLVNDVLDFARPLRFELAGADVNQVCAESAAAAAGGEEGAIRLKLDPLLPEVITDHERLRTALVNLLVNARQAVAAREKRSEALAPGPGAGTGDVRSDIELSTRRLSAECFEIAVRDTGVGIEAADLPRVFEPYFTTRRSGTGLGLAISRNILEGLGGAIRISSTMGNGTEIRIELPLDSERRHRRNGYDSP
jgi:signal transduction histidine kinase